jgi:hypothetical protein
MKKARPNAAKLAVKRHKADLRRKKASDKICLRLNPELIVAAWLTTKPEADREGILERYATYGELLDVIRLDTASHEAMWAALDAPPIPAS